MGSGCRVSSMRFTVRHKQKFHTLPVKLIFALPMILVLLTTGCIVARPTVTYEPLQESTFGPRSRPASVSLESATHLIQHGYVKIGHLTAKALKRSCRRYLLGGEDVKQVCRDNPVADPIPALLQQAGEAGGDLLVVVFEQSHTERMSLLGTDGFFTKHFSITTAAVWRKAE